MQMMSALWNIKHAYITGALFVDRNMPVLVFESIRPAVFYISRIHPSNIYKYITWLILPSVIVGHILATHSTLMVNG